MTEVQAASHSCITFAMKKTHFSSLSSAHLCKPAMLGFVFHDICRPQPQVLEDFRGCAPIWGRVGTPAFEQLTLHYAICSARLHL